MQANAFKITLQLMVESFKDDLKDLRKKVAEIKLRLWFTKSKFVDATFEMDMLDERVNANESKIKDFF